jgi:succinyl-CoA synthetase alpha subunit
MGVLISKSTRVLIQGMTGYQGEFHTARMREFGTQVVAGVTPGKGGINVQGVPVFETIAEAVHSTGATAACIFVPARAAKDAALEAIEEQLNPVVIITEGIPVHDTLQIVAWAGQRGVHVVGPNCPGLTTPGQCKIGIMPNPLFREGPVGVISRSGTLTYEIVAALTQQGIGQSTALGLGGDPVVGMSFKDGLRLFEDDPQTKAVVLIGEIGGGAEEEAAQFISAHMTKPVIGYIAGRTAPPGKRMGHAGAVISGTAGTAESKIAALQGAGVKVATLPADVVGFVREVL